MISLASAIILSIVASRSSVFILFFSRNFLNSFLYFWRIIYKWRELVVEWGWRLVVGANNEFSKWEMDALLFFDISFFTNYNLFNLINCLHQMIEKNFSSYYFIHLTRFPQLVQKLLLIKIESENLFQKDKYLTKEFRWSNQTI